MDLEINGFDGYGLLSSGEVRKLERFGEVVIDRPCPQAIWPVTESRGRWDAAAAVFERAEGGLGDWRTSANKIPRGWIAACESLRFEIRLTGFGNVGLFPEHACHWPWLEGKIFGADKPSVLNLFAYTGGASMVAAKAGATVTHVDSAKSVNGWAMTNAELSSVPDDSIRYIADDALKFVKREARRGRRYHGVVMDPPTFGRGAKGEVWKIERDLAELVEITLSILAQDPLFFLVTSHSPGITPRVLRTMLSSLGGEVEQGEMLIRGKGPPLPAGSYARWAPR